MVPAFTCPGKQFEPVDGVSLPARRGIGETRDIIEPRVDGILGMDDCGVGIDLLYQVNDRVGLRALEPLGDFNGRPQRFLRTRRFFRRYLGLYGRWRGIAWYRIAGLLRIRRERNESGGRQTDKNRNDA